MAVTSLRTISHQLIPIPHQATFSWTVPFLSTTPPTTGTAGQRATYLLAKVFSSQRKPFHVGFLLEIEADKVPILPWWHPGKRRALGVVKTLFIKRSSFCLSDRNKTANCNAVKTEMVLKPKTRLLTPKDVKCLKRRNVIYEWSHRNKGVCIKRHHNILFVCFDSVVTKTQKEVL